MLGYTKEDLDQMCNTVHDAKLFYILNSLFSQIIVFPKRRGHECSRQRKQNSRQPQKRTHYAFKTHHISSALNAQKNPGDDTSHSNKKNNDPKDHEKFFVFE